MAKKATTKKEETLNVPAVATETGLTTSDSISAAMIAHVNIDKSMFAGYEQSIDNELFKNDIIIPKIWLVQQMSEAFKQGKAGLGHYISSQTLEAISNGTEEILFIPLNIFKRWQTFKVDAKGNKEFFRSDIITRENIHWPYEDTIEGEQVVRRQVISVYVVLAKDVMKGLNIPYVIDFASTSKGAGRSLITDVATIEKGGYPMFLGFFKLTSYEDKIDKNEFFVKKVQFGGYVNSDNPKLIEHLVNCYNHIKTSKEILVPDDSDIIREQTVEDLDAQAIKNRKASADI